VDSPAFGRRRRQQQNAARRWPHLLLLLLLQSVCISERPMDIQHETGLTSAAEIGVDGHADNEY